MSSVSVLEIVVEGGGVAVEETEQLLPATGHKLNKTYLLPNTISDTYTFLCF